MLFLQFAGAKVLIFWHI